MNKYIKEFIRQQLQYIVQFWTICSTHSVCLWCLNFNMSGLITNICKGGYGALFLPKVKDKYRFSFNYILDINDSQIIKFTDLVSLYTMFFISENIRYYVFDKLTPDDFRFHAALLSAKAIKDLKVVYLDHGDSAQENPFPELMLLSHVDYFYARDLDKKEYLIGTVKKYGLKTIIRTWIPSLRHIKRDDVDNRLLLVAPAFHCGESLASCYSDTFKYRVRKTMLFVLEKLAEKYDLKILWKYMPDGFDVVPKLIYDYKLKRVVYDDRSNFNKWLSKAGMFISDCASTTLYDAIKVGIPSIALWHSKLQPIRKSALKMFGSCIHIYDDVNEIENILESFISKTLSGNVYIPKIETVQEKYPWQE